LEAETGKGEVYIGGGVFQHLTVRGKEILLFGGDGAGVDQDESLIVSSRYALDIILF
jgi:hypothetical protein